MVLANEESQGGKCDRCGGEVVQKEKEVWMLKITDYADKLLEELGSLDYLPRIKTMQENWIGKSTGAEANFKLNVSGNGIDESLKIYTTRPDTMFGVTFMVIAPEHPILQKYKDKIENLDEVLEYAKNAKKKTEFERVQLAKDKTGIEIKGITATNPVNGKTIPVWISDYVMMGYGTGAIMAVPAHDTRDYEFAKKFGIDIIDVIDGRTEEGGAYTDIYKGKMINSDFLNGLEVKEAIKEMVKYLEEENIGKEAVNFFMKDWAFARQRYWGEPVPIIKCEKCGLVAVPEKELPLKLPEVEDFRPGEGGESPLVKVDSWVNVKCPKCGLDAKRETDTMPQWAGSSWYYLRYTDPRNHEALASKENLKYWLPVDWYNGGMEHVTRHLIYSRFWHRFLYDNGIVPTKEPYAKRTAQGLILGSDNEKMSKSRGNVVNPDDITKEYGADTLRTYILFIGDYEMAAPWSDNGVKGAKKFLDRVIRLKDFLSNEKDTEELERELNKTIKKVTEDYNSMKYNTAIAQMMTFVNVVYKTGKISKESLSKFLIVLNPIAPHVSEELWSMYNSNMIIDSSWPSYDENKIKTDEIELAVQVNGNVKFKVIVPADSGKEEIEKIVMESDYVMDNIDKEKIKKLIIVPGRIVSFVI